MEKFVLKEPKISWFDEHRGGIIFYGVLTIVSIFGIFPWMLGLKEIFKFLF